MKKLWGVFWITEVLILVGTAAAAVALGGLHWGLGSAAGVSGAVAAAAYPLHFRSLDYALENGCVVMRKGFIIRSRRVIPVESILMIRSAALFGRTLYTALCTAGGTAALCCRIELSEISDTISESDA